jgi:hypothetical protein
VVRGWGSNDARARRGVEAQSAKADLVPFQRRVSNPSGVAAASMLAIRSVAWDMLVLVSAKADCVPL